MARIRLIHGDARKVRERAARLRELGHRVEAKPLDSDSLKALKSKPPDAVVIDLGRAPAAGRDLGLYLRKTASTRRVPLVFVGGDVGKVEETKKHLPDATYASWRGIKGAIERALSSSSVDPVVPDSIMAGYSGTPLFKKLGIKNGTVVALVGAPPNFEGTIGALPEGASLRRGLRGRFDLIIWFPSSESDLARRVASMAEKVTGGGMWIAWPKQASGIQTDLTQALVRRVGLDSGLIDFKICAIDETFSGLKFTRRKK